MSRTAAIAAALVLSLAACTKKSATPGEPGAPGEPVPAATGAAPIAASAAYVSTSTTLRREPSEAARVPGLARKDVTNVLAVLLRGEKVTLLEARDEWARVRASDDREGWVKRGSLLEGDGLGEATVLVAADVFDRPDLLAANARRKIDPGTLLLVVKTKPPFSEVNVGAGPNAWVLSDRLATGEKEVSVAKLAEKARSLKRSGKEDEARQILALAREHFTGVPLVDALAVELGEAPPPGGEVVPAADELPPGR